MEDWQKDFLATVELVALECQQCLESVGELVEAIAEEVTETCQTYAEEMQNDIEVEIDRFIENLFQPIIDIHTEFEYVIFEEELVEETDFSLNPKVEPTSEIHSACMGCSNYHGRVYGGNLLVCGMHPYGWDGENCPDWEQNTPETSNFDEDIFSS